MICRQAEHYHTTQEYPMVFLYPFHTFVSRVQPGGNRLDLYLGLFSILRYIIYGCQVRYKRGAKYVTKGVLGVPSTLQTYLHMGAKYAIFFLLIILNFIIFPSSGDNYLKNVVYLYYDVTGILASQKETSNKIREIRLQPWIDGSEAPDIQGCTFI